jgi:hypothetical protein
LLSPQEEWKKRWNFALKLFDRLRTVKGNFGVRPILLSASLPAGFSRQCRRISRGAVGRHFFLCSGIARILFFVVRLHVR